MNLGTLETRFLYINQAIWIHAYDRKAQVLEMNESGCRFQSR